MSRIVVLGGGVIGLMTAMMLARQSHDVTVLEHDREHPPGSPEEAWHTWDRRGVAQFRQPHYLHSAGRRILDRHLPDVKEALLRSGCIAFDMTTVMPAFITDRARREDDERFVTVTGRRAVVEYAVASTAERFVRVVRGVSATELITGTSVATGIPHVIGVHATDGKRYIADLVVDAMGRRSRLPDWLEAVGARRPIEDAEESGFFYYTRFFRSTNGTVPAYRSGFQTHFHSFTLLTLPGDAQTWSVTVFVFTGDPPLKALRDSARWTALIAACPLHAHWLNGEPITDVLPMGGFADRYRRFVVDGAPVATGVLTVGDAWACTNPVGGRGITMGLIHALGTVEAIREHADDPVGLALAHDLMTEERVTPWYRNTVEFDRLRNAQIYATINGRTVSPPTDPGSEMLVAMMYDPDLFRAAIEISSLLALPEEVLARPGVFDRLTQVASAHERVPPPGPSREELLRMLA
jgi:2-polyprenyl-6-methoxyphenol hydroxylase-like FAD-dependent oxidoreductase